MARQDLVHVDSRGYKLPAVFIPRNASSTRFNKVQKEFSSFMLPNAVIAPQVSIKPKEESPNNKSTLISSCSVFPLVSTARACGSKCSLKNLNEVNQACSSFGVNIVKLKPSVNEIKQARVLSVQRINRRMLANYKLRITPTKKSIGTNVNNKSFTEKDINE